ncbi:hypothetical protein CRENBAI_019862 [Crenichthys baileyi]|uniref:Uncharacterized protein n=1 Tax=Crenichthys baileyi TaxID=28760 RepID=A0AAV9RCZ0_9TELE
MGLEIITTITGGAVGAVGPVALAPVVLGAIGFTSTGIAAGSYAASMMSAAAVTNGGGVAAGSLVAVLQSAGAAGLSPTFAMVLAITGGTIGTCVGRAVGCLSSIFQRRREKKKEEDMEMVISGIAIMALIMWLKK